MTIYVTILQVANSRNRVAACCSIAQKTANSPEWRWFFSGSTFPAAFQSGMFTAWNCLTTHRPFESGDSLEIKISQDIFPLTFNDVTMKGKLREMVLKMTNGAVQSV
jgi:hypothetical protein